MIKGFWGNLLYIVYVGSVSIKVCWGSVVSLLNVRVSPIFLINLVMVCRLVLEC